MWHMLSAHLNCPDSTVVAKAAKIAVFKRDTGGQLNKRSDSNFQ